jgi:hypothetical protein
MSSEGITVSSVGLGGGVDETMLKMIADVGQGRYWKAAKPEELPKIFTRETELVSRSAAVEEYIGVRVVSPADFMRGIDMSSVPYLRGYVATKMKPPPAQEILESENQEPILARWHVGIGWTIAWTTDVKNNWAADWIANWKQYGQMWGQLVREHMKQKKRQTLDMRAEVDTSTGRVHAYIDAIGSDDKFQNGLEAKLTVKAADSAKTDSMAMQQTAPGRYEIDYPLDHFGAFLLNASLEKQIDDGQGGVKSVQVAESNGQVTNPYPREYLAFEPDTSSLEPAAKVTGGSCLGCLPNGKVERADAAADATFLAAMYAPGDVPVIYYTDLWPKFVSAAIVCFLLDLLVRRVRIFDRKRTAKPPLSKRPVAV